MEQRAKGAEAGHQLSFDSPKPISAEGQKLSKNKPSEGQPGHFICLRWTCCVLPLSAANDGPLQSTGAPPLKKRCGFKAFLLTQCLNAILDTVEAKRGRFALDFALLLDQEHLAPGYQKSPRWKLGAERSATGEPVGKKLKRPSPGCQPN